MEADRWQQVKELFHWALGRPPGMRRDALLARCVGDRELVEEVESLLAAHVEDDDGFLSALPLEAQTALGKDPADDPMLGRRVGRYQLDRLLGRGGMGTVYEGHRVGDELPQRVAIKLFAVGHLGPGLRERFLQERRILAALEHPNIARFLDGDSTDGGIPYLVMELVEGEPIDRYCDRRALPISERLRLVLAVCEAAAFAHRRLIVHRDLKPANILVTVEGVPKLLDFGVAKLLDQAEDGGAPETAIGTLPMTPEYASPEQLRGEPVSTASDVYSLGVVLYELLTGRLPYELRDRSPDSVSRVVAASEPPRPSTAVTAAAQFGDRRRTTPTAEIVRRRAAGTAQHLRRRLEGDLDNIVLKCLAKEAEHRYATPMELADDLRRHLGGHAVLARGQSIAYRTAKFVRRNRAVVAVGLVMAALLLALSTVSVRYVVDLRREHDRATTARLQAEVRERESREITDFLVELFEAPSPSVSRGETITARELLDAGTEKIAERLGDQPLTRARLLRTMGNVYSGLGLWEAAEPLLETSLELRRAAGPEHQAETSDSLRALASLAMEQHRWELAESRAREALSLILASPDPDAREVGDVRRVLASSLRFLGRLDEAEAQCLAAIHALEEAPGSNEDLLLIAREVYAGVLAAQGRYREAEPIYLDLLEDIARASGADHPTLARIENNLAFAYRRQERFEEAERYYRMALELQDRTVGKSSPNTLRLLRNLAAVTHESGDVDETERLLREVVARQRSAMPEAAPEVADDLVHSVAELLLRERRYREAEAPLREALDLRRRFQPDSHFLATDQAFLAVCLIARRRLAEARELLSSAAEWLELPDPPPALQHRIGRALSHLDAVGAGAEADPFREAAKQSVQGRTAVSGAANSAPS